jgi:phage RecT family recombinase
MSETKMQVAQKNFSAMTPREIIESEKVQKKFVQIYQMMHGKSNGESFYQREAYHFTKQLSEKPEVAAFEKLSIYGCFLDAAVNDLSFDPGMKQVYLVPFNVNVGTKDNPQWVKKCQLMVSAYGELHMRIRAGQIKHADNPVLVYEGDTFEMGTRNGGLFVEHKATFPRKSDNIIACYVRLERPDGTVDYRVLSREEIEKLRASSKQPNSPAWTTHIAGMIMNKTLKHAFKSYPRIRLRGQFAKVEEEIEETPFDDYSLDEQPAQIAPVATHTAPASSNGKMAPNPAVNGNGISPEAKAAQAAMSAEVDESAGVNHDDVDF